MEETPPERNEKYYYHINNTELPKIEVVKRDYVGGNVLRETTLTAKGSNLRECLDTIFILKNHFKDEKKEK